MRVRDVGESLVRAVAVYGDIPNAVTIGLQNAASYVQTLRPLAVTVPSSQTRG